jgi:hypothetical protein
MELAQFYNHTKARDIINDIKRGHRLYTGLLAADAHFVDALVRLASSCRTLKGALEKTPGELSKMAHRPIVDVMDAMHLKLRRLYDQQAFVSFGSLIFLDATRALHAVDGVAPPAKAVLRIRPHGESSSPELVFLNDGWRHGGVALRKDGRG